MTKTSSWATAVANAHSMIYVEVEWNSNAYCVSVIIPKDRLISTDKYFMNSYYVSDTNFGYVQVQASLSSAIVTLITHNGTVSTHTDYFYYD